MNEMDRRLKETYDHIEPYLYDKDCRAIYEPMCFRCEGYDANGHDFEECLDKPCFRFYLAYEYLNWQISFGG